MFAQLKLYIAGGVLLLILALSATIWVQGGRIDRLKLEVKSLTGKLATVVDANKNNAATIAELTAERDKAGKLCAKRLADKQIEIDTLNAIDAHRGGNNGNHEGRGGPMWPPASGQPRGVAPTAGVFGADTINAAFNGVLLGSLQDGGQGHSICKTASAAVAGGAQVEAGNILYCLDKMNYADLLKDIVMCRAWALDGVQAIEGMKGNQ